MMEFDWQVSKIQENRQTSYDHNNTTGLSSTVAMWLTLVNNNDNYVNFISILETVQFTIIILIIIIIR